MTELKTTGYNAKTAENLLLDAGAIYKNFDKETMAGDLIGATQGGNTFNGIPNMRNIPVDGVKSEHVKGLTVIDSWAVSLVANMLEVKVDTLTMALGAVDVTEHNENYDSIKGRNYLLDSDYLENIAYVGRMSKNNKPIIIIIDNVLSHEGLSLATQDASQGIIPMTLFGHMDSDDLENPPFEILYPKPAPVEPPEEG